MILLLVTYLAGALTILSPCILPVLPFVFARSERSFAKSTLPLLAGMCLTFSLLSALAILGGEWLAHASEVGRGFALIFLSLFGLSLIFPHLAESALAPLTRAGGRIGGRNNGEGAAGSFLIGVSTGLLWAPCAGPILGLVLTGAASQKNLGASLRLLFAYSLGAATSLSLALFAGKRVLGKLKKFLGLDRAIKRGLGVAVLLGVFAIALHWDQTILARVSKFKTEALENRLLSWGNSGPEKGNPPGNLGSPAEAFFSALSDAGPWLNSPPLRRRDLQGKVVIVDFWTYSCINCLRTLPYVKAWADMYGPAGLVVLGIHTPEFAFEKNPANVEKAARELGLTYPIALDNEYRIWNSVQNQYWPAHYFIDRTGRLRHHHFGEGGYEESERWIRDLLSEGGSPLPDEKASPRARGVQLSAANTINGGRSPETYLGYARTANFASRPELRPDQIVAYRPAAEIKTDAWSLDGKWRIEKERATLHQKNGKLGFRFRARDVHLVLGGAGRVRFKVTIDGRAPGADHGVDTDENGNGEIDFHRLYQLIRRHGNEATSAPLFEIEFFDSGVEAYAFTFG